MPKWITDKDRISKRHGIEEMVSGRDTSSDSITNLGEKFHPLCVVRNLTLQTS
jgi:hypothetical protein